ncbi:MAG: DUF4253 domain-containing protein [Verrucomicrobiota bacterium]
MRSLIPLTIGVLLTFASYFLFFQVIQETLYWPWQEIEEEEGIPFFPTPVEQLSLSESESDLLSGLNFDLDLMQQCKAGVFGNMRPDNYAELIQQCEGDTFPSFLPVAQPGIGGENPPYHAVSLMIPDVGPSYWHEESRRLQEFFGSTHYMAFMSEYPMFTIMKDADQWDYLQLARPGSVISTGASAFAIEQVRRWNEKHGVILIQANREELVLSFEEAPNDWTQVAREMIAMVPHFDDVLAEDGMTREEGIRALVNEIEERGGEVAVYWSTEE